MDYINTIPTDRYTEQSRLASQTSSCHQQNRRYLGNKHKLTRFIKRIVDENCGSYTTFCDLFAGTGVVGAAFNSPGVSIMSNDLLSSNYVCLRTFLGVRKYPLKDVVEKIRHLNSLQFSTTESNYFSNHFGGTYFSQPNAIRIGLIREEIERIASDREERNILLCSLIYAVDKIANTVGHYDAYRKKLDSTLPLRLRMPFIDDHRNQNNKIFQDDANVLSKRIECDVLYLDPPYNSRQYSDAYHLLENLTEWKKPAVRGIAKKFDRSHLKSKYCVNGAGDALDDLVKSSNCRHILLSYNNTGKSRDDRSNARISDSEIYEILNQRGPIKTFEAQYRMFTTERGSRPENVERIFYCRVRDSR